MQPTRFQLEAASLDALRARVTAEYGGGARIISAERVTVGGIGGFLARKHIEAVIEVPGTEADAGDPDPDQDQHLAPERAVLVIDAPVADPAPQPGDRGAGQDPVRARGRRAADPRQPLPEREALVSLLAEADDDEAHWHGRTGPDVSTESEDFDRLMDDLTFGAQPSHGARAARLDAPVTVPARPTDTGTTAPTGPVPLRGPGDLVVVVGLGADAHRAAAVLAGPGPRIHASGAFGGDGAATPGPRIGNRMERVQAQAAGVGSGEPVYIACGLDHSVDLETQVHEVEALGADQLWVSVDAGRKGEDTRAWVEALDAVCPVDAVAVHGRATTSTPDTVLDLGIPLRDIDQPASPPLHRAPRAR